METLRAPANSIGYLAPERLANLSEKYWSAHEFCFYLHDQLLHLLRQFEQSGAHNIAAEAVRKAVASYKEPFADIDLLDFMKANGLEKLYEHHLLSHATLAITADMLNFLYEALSAFEKRKFSVGFSLLRKPFKEHLLFLSWVLADKDDFLGRFEFNNHKTLNNLGKDKKIEIFSAAAKATAFPEMFCGELIWGIIFSKTSPNSFEPLFQKATHLVTSMGELLKTEDRSLNFIFSDSSVDYFHDRLYQFLPYILIFTIHVGLEVFGRIHKINKLTYTHLIFTSIGCYEALFGNARSQKIAKLLNKTFSEILKCTHCKRAFRISKSNAIELLLKEQIYCKHCRLSSPLPLYWLFGQTNVSVNNEGVEDASDSPFSYLS